jgi:ketosteroid isomerase-like protein
MLLRGLALGVLVVVPASLASCGDGSEPTSDRQQIEALVNGLFEDAAAKDAEGVCAVLTEDGWAHAVQRHFLADEPLRSADEDDCVRERAPAAALKSTDLPGLMKNDHRPHVERLRVLGDRATGVVRFTLYRVRWAFRKTDGGWKIESFAVPVRE